MKVVVFLVIALNITLVYTYLISPFVVHRVTNESLWGPKIRIFGGDKAEDNQFPFMIFMLIVRPQNSYRCSASLVNPYWVLTAAHCVNVGILRPDEVFLVGGKANVEEYVRTRLSGEDEPFNEEALGVQERRAQAVYIHTKYDTETNFHDVALIRLEKPFDSPNIKTISISKEKMEKPMHCTILGWGFTEEDFLEITQNYLLHFLHDVKAKTVEMGCKYNNEGPLICLDSKKSGICRGDSGSPLVCDNKVWGVASFYLYEEGNNLCANSFEDYYSELYSNLEWIDEHVRGGGNPSAVVTTRNLFVLTGFWFFLRNSLHVFKI